MGRYVEVSGEDFDRRYAAQLAAWIREGHVIRCEVTAPTFSAAATLAMRIAEIADELDHHPDIDIRYPGRVLVSTFTHDTGGLTMHDVALARRISELFHNKS